MQSDEPMKNIKRQIEGNKHLNLLFEHLEREVSIDENFRAHLLKLKTDGVKDISSIVDYTVRETIRTIYQINQYLAIPGEEINRLRNMYINTWNKIDRQSFDRVIRNHHRKLSRWIAQFYPDAFLASLQDSETIGKVKNEEYSARFQESLYNTTVEDLMEPILDLGCGEHAYFANHLHEAGKQVVGIDRLIQTRESYLVEIDWFDFPLEQSQWGTVTANMSFSNHLLYTLHNDKDRLLNYYLKYREIIDALKPGGRFLYAPSLPFIEDRLETDQYKVERREVTEDCYVSIILRT